jgi:hypothetical protein
MTDATTPDSQTSALIEEGAREVCSFEDERHDVLRCRVHGGYVSSDSWHEADHPIVGTREEAMLALRCSKYPGDVAALVAEARRLVPIAERAGFFSMHKTLAELAAALEARPYTDSDAALERCEENARQSGAAYVQLVGKYNRLLQRLASPDDALVEAVARGLGYEETPEGEDPRMFAWHQSECFRQARAALAAAYKAISGGKT